MASDLLSPEIIGLLPSSVDFRQLVDEIPLGVCIMDHQRCVVYLNRTLQALTGFSQEQISAYRIPCHHIIRSRLCVTGCPALKFKEKSQGVTMESDLINTDRQMAPIRVTLAPIVNDKGDIAGFIETIEDLRAIRENEAKIHRPYSLSNVIGKSPQMEKIFQILPVIAQSDSSVLITGETGTGKDLVAEAIHRASDRAKGPFIKVNCGALPETLLESELFGHQKGAFTGAVENKPGRFRLAHNGTLYLTEIGDLPLSLQVKLLTFLDDKIVYPLGSTKGFQADVRVIAATHRNLEQMVHENRFREDLLFRLNVVRLHLPPLRERGDDSRILLDYFLGSLASKFGKNISGFSPKSIQLLKNYHYPGNVRELKNIVEYAANVCPKGQVQPTHLPAYLNEEKMPTRLSLPPNTPDSQTADFDILSDSDRHSDMKWTEVEKKMIIDALIKAGGRRSKAAELLGWGRSTLWRKMKQYEIDQ